MSTRTFAKSTPPKFRVGDWVTREAGGQKLLAVVIEDCGLVGLKAKRFYRLREFPLWTPPLELEFTEDHLEPAEPPTELPEPHDKFPMERAAWRRLDD